MKKYLITWERSDWGRYVMEAESAEEAREKFDMGEWEEEGLNIKGGNMEVSNIVEME